jgi:hypothetical protein
MRNYSIDEKLLSKLVFGIAIASSTIFSTANPARADHTNSNDPWTRQVANQLIRAAEATGYRGYTLTHNPFIDALGRGGQDDITLSLSQGVSYAIIGVCDDDCRDIDLQLYDDNGNLVASDVERDDLPILKIVPRWSARFTIRVSMSRCANSPCRYGIGAFGR